jgi:hypothetical protein
MESLQFVALPKNATECHYRSQIKKQINQWLYLLYSFSAGSEKWILTGKQNGFAYRKFGIKA